jgi:hypothetical protein
MIVHNLFCSKMEFCNAKIFQLQYWRHFVNFPSLNHILYYDDYLMEDMVNKSLSKFINREAFKVAVFLRRQ